MDEKGILGVMVEFCHWWLLAIFEHFSVHFENIQPYKVLSKVEGMYFASLDSLGPSIPPGPNRGFYSEESWKQHGVRLLGRVETMVFTPGVQWKSVSIWSQGRLMLSPGGDIKVH